MGLHVVRFNKNHKVQWGVLFNNQIKVIRGSYATLAELLESGIEDVKSTHQDDNAVIVSLKDVTILSPVTRPAQIVCQGANYSAHRAEAGLDTKRPPFNMIFTKADSSLSAPNSDIICPENVKLLDYEAELGLIIGKNITATTRITNDNLHEYVAGLVVANDVSARDIQIPQGQWFKGKSYRTFCPTGPYLYLLEKEDVKEFLNLEVKLWVNDEERQTANTSQLIFKPDETLTELSEIMDLSVGDMVLTGTAGGVAMKLDKDVTEKIMNPLFRGAEKMKLFVESQMNNTKYLKSGDTIRCTIYSSDGTINLGEQVNKVVATSK